MQINPRLAEVLQVVCLAVKYLNCVVAHNLKYELCVCARACAQGPEKCPGLSSGCSCWDRVGQKDLELYSILCHAVILRSCELF